MGRVMQTFDDLEHKLLNQHGDEYKAFTRLLLTISIACITVLASVKTDAGWLYVTASVLLFLSVLFGVLVQHRIMMNPIYHLEDAAEQVRKARESGSEDDIKIRRRPTKIEQVFYRLQASSFVAAFLFLAVQLAVKAI